jgi:hypothetical protein
MTSQRSNRGAGDATQFKVFGAFELSCVRGLRGGVRLCSETTKDTIERTIKRDYPHDNLLTKKGCYIYAIRTGGRGQKGGAFTPWYVGKAHRQSLLDESLSDRNFNKIYSVAFDRVTRGTPVLFWIAKAAPGQKEAANAGVIADMEKALIWHAVDCNPELLNIVENPRLFGFEIAGLPLVAQHDVRTASKGPARHVAKMLGLVGQ